MPPPVGDYIKYVVGGAVASDSWTVSHSQQLGGLTGIPTPTVMNALASTVLGAFNTTYWNPSTNKGASLCNTGTNLATLKAYLYRNGVLSAQGAAAIAPVAGTSGTALPNYVAMCVSLLSNMPGKSGRGRMYLPATGAAIAAATGQYSSTLTAILTNLASYLDGINAVLSPLPGSPSGACAVVSNTHGLMNPVTSIRTDSLPDTQHGRTRKDIATAVYSATL